MPSIASPYGIGAVNEGLQVFENTTSATNEIATGRRCAHTAISPSEQSDAELIFECSDASAEIGLLERERVRRFAEAATALRNLGIEQMLETNRHCDIHSAGTCTRANRT